jgi:CheY-like chemotaxis protein
LARKILLADDSVTAQNMGRKILTDAGYEVITVNNGSAALKRIAEQKPDLIVLDVYMPGYSGLEVCQRIKENRDTARIPVLLTVGKLEPFKPEEARRARADAFVVKPFEASELLATLTRLEDKIVPQPQPYKPGRFAKAFAAVEQDSGEKFGDADGGWKDRLRFPSRKPKPSEPDPTPEFVSSKGLHDSVPPVPPPPPQPVGREPEFELVMPAGIPRDITPEEIAAIAAAAAKMSGAVAEVSGPPVMEAPPVTVHESSINAGEAPSPTPETSLNTDAIVAYIPPQATLLAAEAPVEPSEPVTFAAALSAQVSDGTAVAPALEVPRELEPAVPQPATDAVAPESAEKPTSSAKTLATEASFGPNPPVHSDAEVMAALQALVPPDRHGPATIAGDVLNQSLDPAPEVNLAVMAAELTQTDFRSRGPRWVPEEVALSAEEASLSLEREMEKAYAAFAASEGARFLAASDISAVPEPIGVTQQTAAVTATKYTPQAFEDPVAKPVEVVSESVATEPAVLAMASAAAAGDPGLPTITVQMPAAEASAPLPKTESEIISPAFEASTLGGTSPTVAQPGVQPLADANLSSATLDTEIVGGVDEMGKKDWADFRSIRAAAAVPKTAPVTPSDSPVVAPEDSTKTEPETGTPTSPFERVLSATDPKAIASIVDSVLAELRPKIVEEIARKLSDPKKD